jgi:hypothetical protein
MNSVRLARPRTSRTDIAYMGTGLYGFFFSSSSSGAVARGRRLSRPSGGRYCHAGTAGTVSLVTT